ncbi:MAG: hypothetical protein HYZ65_11780 [Burkholderiales bacterium]|nr:hypothetical protein [Burkholderiales bacterium]
MKIKEITEGLDTPARPQTIAAPKAPATTTLASAKATADKTRLNALKTTADAAGDRLKAERDTQKKAKAVQTLQLPSLQQRH